MRLACASRSVNAPSITASSRLPSTMWTACALNSPKNSASRRSNRLNISLLEAQAEPRQFLHFIGIKSPLGQGSGAAFTALGRGAPHRARGAREARRRRRLLHSGQFNEALPSDIVRIAPRLGPGKHRGEAGVRSFEYLAPFVAGFGFECLFQHGPHLRPARA